MLDTSNKLHILILALISMTDFQLSFYSMHHRCLLLIRLTIDHQWNDVKISYYTSILYVDSASMPNYCRTIDLDFISIMFLLTCYINGIVI